MLPLDQLQAGTLLFGLITVRTIPRSHNDLEEEEEEEPKAVIITRQYDGTMNVVKSVLIYFFIKRFFWVFLFIIMPCALYYFKMVVLKKIRVVIPAHLAGGQEQTFNMQELYDSFAE